MEPVSIKKCPQCQMDVSPLAKKCPHCRSKLPQPMSSVKVVLLGAIGVAIVVQVMVAGFSGESKPSQYVTTPVAAPTESIVNKASGRIVSYEVIDRWTVPNGGEGKVIVVNPDYLNEADMLALGEKLKADTAIDRNAFISVFDSLAAAKLREKVLNDTATKSETDLYDKHFIADYKKNGTTGYHQFSIFFDGVMGVNKKIVTY